MTVPNTVPISGPYTASGSNRTWEYDFKVYELEHLELFITHLDATTEIVDDNFTATGLGVPEGGEITYPVSPLDPLPAGTTVVVRRIVPYEQPIPIGNQGAFFPATHERAFDLLGMQIQQLDAALNVAILSAIGVINSDDIPEGSTNLFETPADRTRNRRMTPLHRPPISIVAGSAGATQRYLLLSKTNRRGLPQALAIDEVNRHIYMLMGDPNEIGRFDLDGPLQQAAEEATLTTTLIAHQSLAVENLVDGTSKLWTGSDDPGYAIRFSFVDGAEPDETEKYRLFEDDSYASCSYVVSSDGRFLVGVQPSQVPDVWQPNLVRVWSLPDLIAAGAGDHRETYLYQWQPAADQFPNTPEIYPIQSLACDGAYVYLLSGYAYTAYPPKIYAYNISTGEIASRGDDLEVGQADAALVSDGLTSEPEGLVIVKLEHTGQDALALLLSQGSVAGQRSNRVYILGRDRKESADVSWQRLNAELPLTITSLHRAFYRSIMDDLWAHDIMNKLALLYFTANVSAAAAHINWVWPGKYTLSPQNSPTFAAWVGYEGNGTDAYLDTGVPPLSLPNYQRDNSHLGVHVIGNGTSTMAGQAGANTINLHPRTPGNNFSSRYHAAVTNNISNSDGSGWFLLNRPVEASYDKYRNNSSLGNAADAANFLATTGNFVFLRHDTNYAAAGSQQLAVAHLGLALDTDRRDALYAIITRWMAEAAGF